MDKLAQLKDSIRDSKHTGPIMAIIDCIQGGIRNVTAVETKPFKLEVEIKKS
jgi:hypothetical protein